MTIVILTLCTLAALPISRPIRAAAAAAGLI